VFLCLVENEGTVSSLDKTKPKFTGVNQGEKSSRSVRKFVVLIRSHFPPQTSINFHKSAAETKTPLPVES
jgi:hypothetical protein